MPEADSERFVCDRRQVGIAVQHHRNTHFEGRRSQIRFPVHCECWNFRTPEIVSLVDQGTRSHVPLSLEPPFHRSA